ncbi:MAG: hypothetical protein QM786_12315 [Breznakibacter sp.]
MNGNLHSQQVPAEVLEQAKVLIEQISTLLSPYLVALSNEDRKSIPKMGEKTLAFVTKAKEYAGQYPDLLPTFVNKAEFDTDVADATNLVGLKARIDQLASLVDDTVMVAGSEGYIAALAFYNNVKLASKQNVPGAKVINDELAQRFTVRTRKVSAN